MKNENDLRVRANFFGRFMVYLSFILIIPIFIYIGSRNNFSKMDVKIDEAASGIDVQLKRRRDTLTKLIDSVKGSMDFEKETMERITRLRTFNFEGASMDEKSKAYSRLNSVTKDLNVTLEAYPNLKSTEAVVEFQKSTRIIEDDIAASRRIYNQNISVFNQKCRTWPSNVAAYNMHLEMKLFFEVTSEDRADVKVDF
jgi:LemA protein